MPFAHEKGKIKLLEGKKSVLLSAAGKGVYYAQKVKHMLTTKRRNCIFISVCDGLVHRKHSLFHGASRAAQEPNYLNGGRGDRGDGCLPLESFPDKDTWLSCEMTNYMFKVTNCLIKIYKRLNTV